MFDKRAKNSVKKGLTGNKKRVLVADMKPGELYCTNDSVLIVFKDNYSKKYFLSTYEIKDQKDISYLFRILYTYATFNNWNLKKEIEREVFVCDSGINYYEMPVIQERVYEDRYN